MSSRVFIPVPASPLTDGRGMIMPDWYLFLSRTIGGSTSSDAEILSSLDTGIDPNAVAAQNAASDARVLAGFSLAAPQDDRLAIEARAAVEMQADDRSEIAELRKEIEQLRAMVWSIVQPPPLPDSAAARITMRI